jgi:hypothetical protein
MKKIIISFLSLLYLPSLVSADSELILSASLLHFDYTEFSSTNRVLDNEQGWLPGLKILSQHKGSSGLSFNITGAYYQGIVDYTGQTQSGTPHNTTTNTEIFRIAGQINQLIYKKTHLFAGIQLHKWNRDINDRNNISGIYETYTWQEYAFGINTDFSINKNNTLSASIAYLLVRNARIYVDISRIDLGATTLDIGDDDGARFKLKWKKPLAENTSYGLSLFAESWNFARSNSKLTEGGSSTVSVTEPRSETINIGVNFNIEYTF